MSLKFRMVKESAVTNAPDRLSRRTSVGQGRVWSEKLDEVSKRVQTRIARIELGDEH